MNQPLFIETIKVNNGVFYNLPLHLARLQNTTIQVFGRAPQLNLSPDLVPPSLRQGLVKCRVLYADEIVSVTFEPYQLRPITSLALVECNNIDYSYKSANRSIFEHLLRSKGDCDDILIVKNGLITDTSYTNLVFENQDGLFTPHNCLLEGVKRQSLLEKKIIEKKCISIHDLSSYTSVYLINAMIDLEDKVCIAVESLKTI